MVNFLHKTICLVPCAGAEIEHCKSEALMICVSERCRVRFIHNDIEYVVDYEDLIRQIGEGRG